MVAWFEVFLSLKHNFRLRGEGGLKMCVWQTFHTMDRSQPNYQGQRNSLQKNLGRWFGPCGSSGSGPNPERGFFCQIYLLLGFWGSVNLFWKREDKLKNIWSSISPMDVKFRSKNFLIKGAPPKFKL